MNTINRFEMRSILEYLDAATAALPPSGIESAAAWNIRMAKKRLLDACVSDIEVEPIPGADVATAVSATGPGRMEEAA